MSAEPVDLPEPKPSLENGRVFHWYTVGSVDDAADVLRDSRGTPLLYKADGSVYGYDAVRGVVDYDGSQVERLVAEQGLIPRYTSPPVVKENVAIFVPSGLAPEPDKSVQEVIVDKLRESAAARLAEAFVPKVEEEQP